MAAPAPAPRTGPAVNGASNGPQTNTRAYPISALKKWSCVEKRLPAVEAIKHLHVYDFDNTLFSSPLPNRQLWSGPSIGTLQSQELFNSGWWHDTNILACTGDGIDAEEPRGWDGWWNESIVELVKLSMQQRDAICVLLTGRSEAGFTELVPRMLKSKGLVFDLVCLKPSAGPDGQPFSSTMKFKQKFLEDLVHTYHAADDLRIYEDRVRHVEEFRTFFANLNEDLIAPATADKASQRKPFRHEVVEVAEQMKTLSPVTEAAEVQRMINAHNTAVANGTSPKLNPFQIKRSILYTGYLVSPEDTKRLVDLFLPKDINDSDDEVRTLANNVMICPRPCPPNILQKVGGMGRKMRWKVVGIGHLNSKVWALRVKTISPNEIYHTENPTPYIVLAVKGRAKPVDAMKIQSWQPLQAAQMIELNTVVGEKVLLRIEEERADDPDLPHLEVAARATNGSNAIKNNYEADFPVLGPSKTQQQQAPSGRNGNENKKVPSGPSAQQIPRGPAAHQRARNQQVPSGPRRSDVGNNGASRRHQGQGNHNINHHHSRPKKNPYRSLDDMNAQSQNYPTSVDGAGEFGGLTY